MAHHIFHIAKAVACVLWNRRGDSIGVYESEGRRQMFLIQLDRHYIKVLGYRSALVI